MIIYDRCAGFVHGDQKEFDESFHTEFSVNCAYSTSIVESLDLGALHDTIPMRVVKATIEVSTQHSDYIPTCPFWAKRIIYDSPCSFSYLKSMETRMVAARHLRDDATEFARQSPVSRRRIYWWRSARRS